MNRNNMNTNNPSSTAKSGGRKLRNDIIFISALLAVLICLGLGFYFLRPAGDVAVVTVDGEIYGTYPLDTDVVVEIRTGEGGEQLNRLVIKDGKAYVETASCPDGICSGHKPVYRKGESIVCLPHKVVVTVKSAEAQDQPDIVV